MHCARAMMDSHAIFLFRKEEREKKKELWEWAERLNRERERENTKITTHLSLL